MKTLASTLKLKLTMMPFRVQAMAYIETCNQNYTITIATQIMVSCQNKPSPQNNYALKELKPMNKTVSGR